MNPDVHMAGHLTAFGWLTCGLYLAAAGLAFRAALAAPRREPGADPDAAGLRGPWTALAVGLLALGLNKPLNLQTQLIELGRRQHLAAYRVELHALLFLGFVLGLAAVVLGVRFCWRGRVGPLIRRLPLAVTGVALIGGYLVLRAAAIDHLDQWLGANLEAVPFLWLLEIIGVLLVIVQSLKKPR